MRTVQQFPLESTRSQDVMMPARCQILTAQEQGGRIVLYADVDTDKPMVARRVLIYDTDDEIESGFFGYVATVQLHNYIGTLLAGSSVRHVFAEP